MGKAHKFFPRSFFFLHDRQGAQATKTQQALPQGEEKTRRRQGTGRRDVAPRKKNQAQKTFFSVWLCLFCIPKNKYDIHPFALPQIGTGVRDASFFSRASLFSWRFIGGREGGGRERELSQPRVCVYGLFIFFWSGASRMIAGVTRDGGDCATAVFARADKGVHQRTKEARADSQRAHIPRRPRWRHRPFFSSFSCRTIRFLGLASCLLHCNRAVCAPFCPVATVFETH
nr:hypothetical protein [Pandoravirus massiliensis]